MPADGTSRKTTSFSATTCSLIGAALPRVAPILFGLEAMSDFKTYQLKRVLKLKNRLLQETTLPYYSCTLEGDDFSRFVRAIQVGMPNGIPLDTLYESTRYLAGEELAAARLEELSWRLAGNVDRLKDGNPVRPWTTQFDMEWVPLQVLSAYPQLSHRNRPGYMFCFRVMAGTPCPLRVYRHWTNDVCHVIARHIGFTASWLTYPYSHPLQLVGLRLYGLIDPSMCRDGPGFFKVEGTNVTDKYNRDILRFRVKQPHPEFCPRNYAHDCHKCVVGYMNCPGGTHKDDYVQDACPRCGPGAWFDPASEAGLCVACIEQHT